MPERHLRLRTCWCCWSAQWPAGRPSDTKIQKQSIRKNSLSHQMMQFSSAETTQDELKWEGWRTSNSHDAGRGGSSSIVSIANASWRVLLLSHLPPCLAIPKYSCLVCAIFGYATKEEFHIWVSCCMKQQRHIWRKRPGYSATAENLHPTSLLQYIMPGPCGRGSGPGRGGGALLLSVKDCCGLVMFIWTVWECNELPSTLKVPKFYCWPMSAHSKLCCSNKRARSCKHLLCHDGQGWRGCSQTATTFYLANCYLICTSAKWSA